MRDPLGFCGKGLRDLEERGLLRSSRVLEGRQGPEVRIGGRRLLALASNDYLGLAGDPRLEAAAKEALETWGVGAGAARLITGSMEVHERLERKLAAFKGCEDAVLFSSGFLANLGTLPALVGRGDGLFSDASNHASLIDGARLSRAEVLVFPHREVGDLETRMKAFRGAHAGARLLVATDSLFSMDGDLAPLPGLVELCEGQGALLMVDEAHATGVVGPGGRGAVAHFRLEGRVPVIMGTLSKALGVSGGFVAGSGALCDWLRNRARTFLFDTAPPPALAAAALAALEILEAEPERVERVRALARRMAAGLRDLGFSCPDPAGAIVPIHFGGVEAALRAQDALLERGILIPAIRPPTVPEGGARLRATLSALHEEAQVDRVLEAFAGIRGEP